MVDTIEADHVLTRIEEEISKTDVWATEDLLRRHRELAKDIKRACTIQQDDIMLRANRIVERINIRMKEILG